MSNGTAKAASVPTLSQLGQAEVGVRWIVVARAAREHRSAEGSQPPLRASATSSSQTGGGGGPTRP